MLTSANGMDRLLPPPTGIVCRDYTAAHVGFGADGKIAFRRKIKRLALGEIFKKLLPCVVGMEACLSAHFISWVLRQLGHETRIIPAIYVKPFVKGIQPLDASTRGPPINYRSFRRALASWLVIGNGAPGRTLEIVILTALERPEKSEQADEPEAKR
jgi:hypothetical protein